MIKLYKLNYMSESIPENAIPFLETRDEHIATRTFNETIKEINTNRPHGMGGMRLCFTDDKTFACADCGSYAEFVAASSDKRLPKGILGF